MTCANCMYFKSVKHPNNVREANEGKCLYYPPVIIFNGIGAGSYLPDTNKENNCSKFEYIHGDEYD